MEIQAFGTKINNTIQKNHTMGEGAPKALLQKGEHCPCLDCGNASQDEYAFMSNQADASTQEGTAQQVRSLPQVVTQVMTAVITTVSQATANFSFHIPPQALPEFLPYIMEMIEAFQIREMMRGKGKKPDQSCYSRDIMLGVKIMA